MYTALPLPEPAWDCLRQFGPIESDDQGVNAKAGLPGHKGSSYRGELLGSILPIAAPGPARTGIDNQACVHTTNNLARLASIVPTGLDPD